MEPSFYSRQMERMRPQITAEKDPVTRREMEKTYRHLNKEFRKATRHRNPWHGLTRNVLVLVLIFIGIVWFCAYIIHRYGWGSASTAFAVGVGVLVFVTATGFFATKRMPLEEYLEMVKAAMNNFPWMRSRDDSSSREIQPPSTSSEKLLDGKTGRTIPSLEADASSTEETNER